MHLFGCIFTFLQYSLLKIKLNYGASMGVRNPAKCALPLQVAAVCYRRRGVSLEFLLVNTNGGHKWTFPKGAPEPNLSHSQAAEKEAWEEAGAHGDIEPRHFHIYIHSKGVFWKPPGVQEFAVKAFLMEVEHAGRPQEGMRNPTWFSPEDAKKTLAKGREVKYARELQAVVDHAIQEVGITPIPPPIENRPRQFR